MTQGAPAAQVGLVGLGAMGLPMAGALAASGTVLGHDATAAACERAAASGVEVVPLAELAARCDVVVLSLPRAEVVRQVVAELLAAGSRALLLDTSTIDPEDTRAVAAVAAAGGATYADCPVLGRPEMVGRWTVPVGGPADVVERAAQVLGPVAARVVGVGDVGSAATLKVANNLMFSVINAVTAEALVLAEAAGLDPGVFVDTVLDSGAATVSGLFRSIAPRAVDGDFGPVFSLELTRKDNQLAVTLAERLGVHLEVGSAARDLHARAVAAGHGAEDSVAVVRVLEESLGRPARRHR